MFVFMELIFGDFDNIPSTITEAVEREEFKEFISKYSGQSLGLSEDQIELLKERITLTLASEIYFKELLADSILIDKMMSDVMLFTSPGDKDDIQNMMDSWTRISVSVVNFLSNSNLNKGINMDKARLKTSKVMVMVISAVLSLGFAMGRDEKFLYEGQENSSSVVEHILKLRATEEINAVDLMEQINDITSLFERGEEDE